MAAPGATIDLTSSCIDLADRRARRSRKVPLGRTLHLVDLENLVGGSKASPADVEAALCDYELVVRFGPDDHRVVACARGLAFPAKHRWAGSLVKVSRGIDGADRLLLAEASPDYVFAHYDRVVIASGDHCFAPLVAELDRGGVAVSVVSRRNSLSHRLQLVAPSVWYFDGVEVRAGVA